MEGLLAVQMRHREIQQHHINGVRRLLILLKPFTAVRGGNHPVTGALQHFLRDQARGLLIVDDEDRRLRRVLCVGRARTRRTRTYGRTAGKQGSHGRSLTLLRVDLNRAAVPVNDPQGCGKPQPAAGEFGRKEGVEQGRLGLLGHPASRIGDLEIDKVALCVFVVQIGGAQVALAAIHRAGAHGNDAGAVFEGFRRIHGQIHDELAQLGGIAVHIGKIWGKVENQFGLLRQGRGEQGQHILEHDVEVQGFNHKTPLS